MPEGLLKKAPSTPIRQWAGRTSDDGQLISCTLLYRDGGSVEFGNPVTSSRCRWVRCPLLWLVGLASACELAPASTEPREAALSTENSQAAAIQADTPATLVPCASAELHYPAVKAACAEGGHTAVKKVMSAAIVKAARAGTELRCSSCHIEQKTFGLRPNALDDLAPWL